MNRTEFMQTLASGLVGTATLNQLKNISSQLPPQESLMPSLFIGHGSPMNGIEHNRFSNYWAKLGQSIVQPVAVVCVSAHWLTRGTFVTAMEAPRTIHDFGGFPQALSNVQYAARGSLAIAQETQKSIGYAQVQLDHDWGLDHGTWTVMRHMYPEANIPILQLSIDYHQSPYFHYQLGKELAKLRTKGVLIVGSGNMVHNLRMIQLKEGNIAWGFDWAMEMNEVFKKNILANTHEPLINYRQLGAGAELAIPTPDHYYPLLYLLGTKQKNEAVEIFNDGAVMGGLTMTSVRFG